MKSLFLTVAVSLGMANVLPAHGNPVTASIEKAELNIGKWEYEETKSELDQSQEIRATLDSETEVANIIGRMEKPYISLHCSGKGLFATFIWPDFVGDSYSDKVQVRWKLDDGPVQTSSWFGASRAVGPMGRNAQIWIRQLATAKRMVVRISDRHGGQEAVFDLTGIDVMGPRFSEVSCGR